MSELRPLALDGGGPGLRAALIGAKGDEEDGMGGSWGRLDVWSEGALGGDCEVVSWVEGSEVCVEDPGSMAKGVRSVCLVVSVLWTGVEDGSWKC